MRVSSPTRQPYRLTKQCTATFLPIRTSGAIQMKLAGSVRSCVGAPIGAGSVGKNDAAPLGPNAPGRRLQKPDHAQPHRPVAERGLPLPDALGEVGDHPLQRLSRLDVRAPDVAGAIADHELAPILEALAQLDAPVVDFDRLGGVELVEDQALARPR